MGFPVVMSFGNGPLNTSFPFIMSPFNFKTSGMILPLFGNKRPTHITAGVSLVVQDEKAFKTCYNTKGASGWKFCLLCSNITRIANVSGCPNVKDFKEARPDDYVPHSQASYLAMAEELRRIHEGGGRGSKTQLRQAEKCFGLNYGSEGLIFDKYLEAFVDAYHSDHQAKRQS